MFKWLTMFDSCTALVPPPPACGRALCCLGLGHGGQGGRPGGEAGAGQGGAASSQGAPGHQAFCFRCFRKYFTENNNIDDMIGLTCCRTQKSAIKY